MYTVTQIVSDPEIELRITLKLSDWRKLHAQLESLGGQTPGWWLANLVGQHVRFFSERCQKQWTGDPWRSHWDLAPVEAPKEPAA